MLTEKFKSLVPPLPVSVFVNPAPAVNISSTSSSPYCAEPFIVRVLFASSYDNDIPVPPIRPSPVAVVPPR